MAAFSNNASGQFGCFKQLQCSGQIIFTWCFPVNCNPPCSEWSEWCCYYELVGCEGLPGLSDFHKRCLPENC